MQLVANAKHGIYESIVYYDAKVDYYVLKLRNMTWKEDDKGNITDIKKTGVQSWVSLEASVYYDLDFEPKELKFSGDKGKKCFSGNLFKIFQAMATQIEDKDIVSEGGEYPQAFNFNTCNRFSLEEYIFGPGGYKKEDK